MLNLATPEKNHYSSEAKKFNSNLFPFILLPLFFPASTTTAFAEVNCANAISQIDLNECAYNEYKTSDNELNRVYKIYMNKTNETRKKSLVTLQKQWLKYRDLSCEHEASYFQGGNAQPMVYSSCLRNLTENQIKLIKNWSKQEDILGDTN